MKVRSILIAANNYPTRTDPVYTFLEQIVMALSKRGIKVTVIAPFRITQHLLRHTEMHPRKRIIRMEGGPSITVLQPRYITLGGRFEKFNQLNAQRVVYRIASRLTEKPDICYGYFWHWGFSLYKYAKKNRLPLFVHTGETPIILHNIFSYARIKSFIDYKIGVVCNSSFCKQLSIQGNLAYGEECTVLPNAINPALFYPRNKQAIREEHSVLENDFVVIFTGWFDDNKGSKRVSEAIKLLNDPSIKSVFIGGSLSGDKSCEPDCDGIIHKGRIPHFEIPEWLSMADVFVLPTQHEGCSNGIIEAMACGLPIISSNRSFNWDILNGDNSILIDPMNVDEISKAIKLLKDDKAKRESMSQAALRTASELTIDKRAEKIINYIESKL